MNNHGLRTTGIHTGNFGKAKVQGKRDSLDLSSYSLSKKGLEIPNKEEAYEKLRKAFNETNDPKMKAVLGEMLRARKACKLVQSRAVSKPENPHWEEVRRTR